MSEFIKTSVDGGILGIVIDRPTKKNALTNEMYAALADALDRAATAPEIKVVLISGAGGVFTAGNDISDFLRIALGEVALAEMQVGRFLRNLVALDCPVIAAVDGLAVGIGLTMLLHCDIVYLSESAVLSAPFADLGLVPEAGSSLLLPARIGHQAAFSLFTLGNRLSARKALELGLVNDVVASDQLMLRATEAARSLSSKPMEAVRATKRLLRDKTAMAAYIEKEAEVFRQRLVSPEARAVFASFAARRSPV